MVQYALIVAGGKGLRMGTELPKQFLPIGGKPVLMRTLEAFYDYNAEIRIILVLPHSQQDYWRQLCREYCFSLPHAIADGGETRFHSVKNGLALVKTPALVGVHDGVRPFVAREVIARCYDLAAGKKAVVPVIGVVETVRRMGGKGSVTVGRDDYRLVQTPQVFDAELLKAAYEQPYTPHFTDDASVVEALGVSVFLTPGNRENIKITTPFDRFMFDLATRDIKYLSGVGPQRASVLNKELGIYSLHDLLYYFPYKYVDRSRIYYIQEIDGTMPYIQLKGEILSFETAGEGRQRRLIAHFSDGTGVVDLVWFQGIKYLVGKYKVHQEYIVFGKPTFFNGRINMAHPDIDSASDLKLSSMGLQPYYNTTEKMKRSSLNSHAIEKMMNTVVQQLREPLPETLSPAILAEHHLMPLTEALVNIHFPANPDLLRKAQYRLKFEELFYVQLNILRYAKDRQRKYRGYIFERVGEVFNTFYSRNLPFELTNAQKRVLKEIRKDVGSGKQMNRLLQGDVGSGKTLVALMSMLMALDNGFQACMMAPTEILANQHYETIRELLYGMEVRVELLTGSVKGKRREAILAGLLTGDIHILIGTHAVIEDTVNFASLGLVVIDEQHRFGVAQRARLWTKNVQPPHVLVMTATPIPRTLAMTLYGDLDVSVIDELPPGRKPIVTLHQFDSRRISLYQSMHKQIAEGRQVYIVYPLIKESEKIDLKNLEEGYLHVCEEFPECRVCKVHGKMKPAEKDAQMQLFVSGEAQIMVATTVIEVGVNVPNASVMVIENAERFGLSQLHQLRGRVGRGADQSYCILVTGYKLAEDTRKRLEIMVRTNDGFEIAEADLKLRGPGDLEGTQQSGIAFDLKIADIARDGQLLQYVREVAQTVVDADPHGMLPENEVLWRQLKALRKTNVNWAAIS